jgi:hypothetical protein
MLASTFVVSSIKAALKANVAFLVFGSTDLVIFFEDDLSLMMSFVVSAEFSSSEDDDNHSKNELNELHFINIK